jgi:hypothetical protein
MNYLLFLEVNSCVIYSCVILSTVYSALTVIDIRTVLPPLVSCVLVTMVTSDSGADSRRCDRTQKRKREGMKEGKEVTEG